MFYYYGALFLCHVHVFLVFHCVHLVLDMHPMVHCIEPVRGTASGAAPYASTVAGHTGEFAIYASCSITTIDVTAWGIAGFVAYWVTMLHTS